MCTHLSSPFFFFNDTATTEIYTLSLHDALPISVVACDTPATTRPHAARVGAWALADWLIPLALALVTFASRSEEHTSELQSRLHLVCRLLLEKKKEETRTTEAELTLTEFR